MGCGASSSAAAQPKAADFAAAAPHAHAADTPEGAGDDAAAAAAGSKKPRKPVTLDDDSPPSSPGLAPRPSPAAPADTPVRANVFNPATPLPKTAHDKETPAPADAPTSSVKKGRGDGRKGSVTGTAEKKKASKPKESDDGEDAETEALRQKILAQTDDLDRDDGSHTARSSSRRPSHAVGSKQAAAAAASAAEKAEKEKKKAAERAEKERKERKKEEKRARRRASANSDEGHDEDEEKQPHSHERSGGNTARSSGESIRSARSPPAQDESDDFGRSNAAAAAPVDRWTVGQSSLPNSARKPATATSPPPPTKPPAPVLQLPSWQIGFDAEKFRKANNATSASAAGSAAAGGASSASGANTQRSMVDHAGDDVDVQIATARSVGAARSQESYVPPSLLPNSFSKLQAPAASAAPISSFASTSTSRGPLSSSSVLSMAPTTVLSHEDEALLDDLLNEE